MSAHPNSGTFLPLAVRFAKIVGTVGSGVLAGFYYTYSRHTVPSLLASNAPPEKLVKVFKHVHHASHTPALAAIIASSSSFAYVAYYLFYYYPDRGVSTATFASNSFLPSTSTEHPLGDEWALYGASALLVALVVPYTKVVMRNVQKSLLGAADSVEITEKGKTGVSALDGKKVQSDLEEWQWRSLIRAGLAGAAAGIAIVGIVA